MKLLLLYVVTVAYFAQAVILTVVGDRSGALILFGYTLANCGLIWNLS